jgi:hypothetical protein
MRNLELEFCTNEEIRGGHNTDFFEQLLEKLGEIIHPTSNFFA